MVNKLTRCWIFTFEIWTRVHLSGWCHFCMLRLSKNSYLDDSAHEIFMIPHTNFEIFDDSAYEYCIHPRWLSVLTEYLSLSLTHFTRTNVLIIVFRSLGPFLFKRKLVFYMFMGTLTTKPPYEDPYVQWTARHTSFGCYLLWTAAAKLITYRCDQTILK